MPVFENDIKVSTISDFIENCKKIFIGDIVKKEWSTEKPLQFVPAQYLTDFKITEDNLGDNITENITDLFFYLDSQSISNTQFPFCDRNTAVNKILPDFPFIGLVLQLLKSNKLNVHLIGLSDFLNEDRQIFLNQLARFDNFSIIIYQNYKNREIDKELLSIITEINAELVISVDSGFDFEILKEKAKNLQCTNLKYSCEFEIISEDDFEKCETFISELEIQKYKTHPFYNNSNINFFEKNIFLSKEDIIEAKPTQKEIFARKTINQLNFGKLYILPDGSVYSNLNAPRLGKMNIHNLEELILKEIYGQKNWFKLRKNVKPCKSCIYNSLCPPISNYEYAIGKFNLCHIFEN
ncbi:MAG: TIGR04150 pseudo-rSAM protein [Bacteroidales bacterium]|nr:TIGR04150 pseudo-rSAM protein [Bacteroidales bacterium]MBN2758335.1 TIGR04150 pseudo-rSAM protein [Bacteroidales bacterium]